MAYAHEPVLLEEVIEQMSPRSGGYYVDATVGFGGHAEAILDASAPEGRLLGIDRDPHAIAASRQRLAGYGDRVQLLRERYGRLEQLLGEQAYGSDAGGDGRVVDGLLIDAGVSSLQLDAADRGFSFRNEGPLDMRMSAEGPTCAELIDASDDAQLTEILKRYGEVASASRIARAMGQRRRAGSLNTTKDLAELVEQVSPGGRRRRIHPATQVFQALRIAVNAELDDLERVCNDLPALLADGAVAVIISFHRLEDGIVKRAFRRHSKADVPPPRVPLANLPSAGPLLVLTKRPIQPTEAEIESNPRARSARLRAARRLPREGRTEGQP